MSERVDFSSNAPVYDRRHGAALAPDVARSLALKAALTQGTRVLDVGAGTGRVAHALADLGCDVVALDPAFPMLDQLRSKASTRRVRAVVGEGARLPFAERAGTVPSLTTALVRADIRFGAVIPNA